MRKHPGIEVRGNSIRLKFSHQGVQCRPTLKGIPVTAANLKFAERKLQAVKYEINNGSFDYAAHFPHCPKAKLFGPNRKNISLNAALDDYLKVKESTLAPTTFKSYRNKAERYLRPLAQNGELVRDVTTSELELWIETDLRHLANKSINEVLIIARGVFKRACRDMKIPNPLDDIDNKEISNEPPDPFSLDEIDRILNAPTRFKSEVNMIKAAMWSGMSVEEYFGLAWEDGDLEDWNFKIRRAKVGDVWKVPKTTRRERTIDLLDDAIEAFKCQQPLTYVHQPIVIKVLQRDNRTLREEVISPVFLNTNTGRPHNYSSFLRWWRSHLKKAKVRHRGPNHCRHTFASQLLTAGVSPEWIIYQLGHTSEKMFRQNYGKWMTNDAPPMARIASEQLKRKANKC